VQTSSAALKRLLSPVAIAILDHDGMRPSIHRALPVRQLVRTGHLNTAAISPPMPSIWSESDTE
jgi:hypothetical protein